MGLFKKATKEAAKLRLAIAGPSGSGKLADEVFWPYVDKAEECWLWLGTKAKSGYGVLSRRIDGKQVYAHRFSFALHNGGELPMVVRHSCDNPACVNPSHLVGGTHADNVQDRIARGRPHGKQLHPGRYPSGEAMSNAKLTAEQVKEIRASYRPQTVTTRVLARKYGVGTSTIKRVLQGKTTTMFSHSQAEKIREEYKHGKGYTSNELAQRYGVSRTVIKDILAGRTWKGVS